MSLSNVDVQAASHKAQVQGAKIRDAVVHASKQVALGTKYAALVVASFTKGLAKGTTK